MALDSAMLASSLRRLPTNDNDAAVLAGALRSAEMPAVVRAASSSATPPTMALLAARLAAAADAWPQELDPAELDERRRDRRPLYPLAPGSDGEQAAEAAEVAEAAEAEVPPQTGAGVVCAGEPAIDPSRAFESRQGDSEWSNEGG